MIDDEAAAAAYDPDDYFTATYESLPQGLEGDPGGRPRGSRAVSWDHLPDLAPVIGRADEPGGALQRRGMTPKPGDEVRPSVRPSVVSEGERVADLASRI